MDRNQYIKWITNTIMNCERMQLKCEGELSIKRYVWWAGKQYELDCPISLIDIINENPYNVGESPIFTCYLMTTNENGGPLALSLDRITDEALEKVWNFVNNEK